ncbi:MAG: M1 family metallopeptidase [Candidatus Marsarchaeota archaeon]|nr:M1 family metallopeptidase [Candidatus Marsarchaeota archaeon]
MMSTLGYKTIAKNIMPKNYNLKIETNMKTFIYSCHESISIVLQKPTDKIILDANELDIKAVTLYSKGIPQHIRFSVLKKEKHLSIRMDKKISGDVLLVIDFNGLNNDKMYGFYRSVYKDGSKDKYLLSSQFEAPDARSAFPCFDEPALKATFEVSITVDKGMEAVSNMPVKEVKIINSSRNEFIFQKTPIMSTYLLYLGVGEFESIKGNLGSLPIRVLFTKGKKELAKLPLEYAKKFIAFYENYFGIKYPLPKVDLLAIPDFAAGAMENWGAITFREIAILGDEKTPISIKQQIAETVAHELAHQWFGDLVTMKWWNDLWLNESFATFMSFKAMDAVYPEWNMKSQYFSEVISTAFVADQIKSTHPISTNVRTPEEIDQIFDEISYEKGGTVLHMLEKYAGAEVFQRGLHNYLKKHAYGNATKYDLWGAVEEASKGKTRKFSISKFASAWIDNVGYPIISIKSSNKQVDLVQKRFVIDGSAGKKETWPIPIDFVSNKGVASTFLNEKTGAIKGNFDWIKTNYGQNYLYRSKYSDEMLERLGEVIKAHKLSGVDSWGVENDFFIQIRMGILPIESYLNFISRFCDFPDFPMDISIASHIDWVYRMSYGKSPAKADAAKNAGIKYYSMLLKKLGWTPKKSDTNTDRMLRSKVIHGLGIMGDEDIIKKCKTLFNRYIANQDSIDINIRDAVFYVSAWNGDIKTYKQIISLYKKATRPDKKRIALASLGYFKDVQMAKKTLELSLSKEVRMQDSFTLASVLSINPTANAYLLDWTLSNWQLLIKKYAPSTHMLDRYVGNFAFASDKASLKQIDVFFAKKQNMRADIKKSFINVREYINANIKFAEKNFIKPKNEVRL